MKIAELLVKYKFKHWHTSTYSARTRMNTGVFVLFKNTLEIIEVGKDTAND